MGVVALLVLAAGPGVAGAAQAGPRAAPAGSVTIAAVGDTMLGSTPDLPPSPGSYLGAVRSVLDRGIYPIRFTSTGRPMPGGGASAFTARLGTEDFGSSAARILASGVIKAP
jgi:hypothetical protein